jgi:hypothetical protein
VQPYPHGGYPGAHGYPYPGGGYPGPYPGPYPGAYGAAGYGVGLPRPVAVAPVADTPFGVALVEVRATSSGPAAASLVAGIASALVSLVVAYFVAVGAADGWGAKVGGAFALLATLLCAAAVGLATAALRQIRRSPAWGAVRGRGVAIAGLVCGVGGLTMSALVMVAALATA